MGVPWNSGGATVAYTQYRFFGYRSSLAVDLKDEL